jgi:hypothetical protein
MTEDCQEWRSVGQDLDAEGGAVVVGIRSRPRLSSGPITDSATPTIDRTLTLWLRNGATIANSGWLGIRKETMNQVCPVCKEEYMGDGKRPCVDCEEAEKRKASEQEKRVREEVLRGYIVRDVISEKIMEAVTSGAIGQSINEAIASIDTKGLTKMLFEQIQRSMTGAVVNIIYERLEASINEQVNKFVAEILVQLKNMPVLKT